MTFTPDDPTRPSYTGHFTSWFGDNFNRPNETHAAHFVAILNGSDGSTEKVQQVVHFSVSATAVTVSFERLRCF